MNPMRRRVLQLVGIAAVTIASLHLASALDAETAGGFKTAMGPTSAAQKPGGHGPTSPVTTGTVSESARLRPQRHYRHRHARTLAPTR
jgi:hypothetical protein